MELTPDDVGDITKLPDLLNQIDVNVASMTADGAYDGQVVYDVVAARHPEAAVIIPPRITAVPDETTATQRDEHLTMIAEHGRMSWQRSSGYNRRSLVETTNLAATRLSSAADFMPGVLPVSVKVVAA